MSKAALYFHNLTGLRFIAALTVLIYHVYGEDTLNGHLGVILFFTLSGFLITYLLLEEQVLTNTINVRYFIIRRSLRIWPLYFLTILLNYLLLYTGLEGFTLKGTLSPLWYYIFFLPNVAFELGRTLPYAAILWSVGSEEQFYIVWPFIVKYTRRFFLPVLLFIIVVFTIIPHVLDYINNHYYALNNHALDLTSHVMGRMSFNCMATGGLVAYLWHKKPSVLTWLFHPVIQSLLLILTIFLWLKHYYLRFEDQLFATLFAAIIANLALNKRSLVNLENAVFKYLGKISYGLYMYHIMIFVIVKHFLFQMTGGINTTVFFFTGTIALIVVAGLSYQYFEKPFLRIKDRRFTVIDSDQTAN